MQKMSLLILMSWFLSPSILTYNVILTPFQIDKQIATYIYVIKYCTTLSPKCFGMLLYVLVNG